MKKTPLFYISPAMVISLSLIGIGYAALHSFLNKEWGRGRHDWSEEQSLDTIIQQAFLDGTTTQFVVPCFSANNDQETRFRAESRQ